MISPSPGHRDSPVIFSLSPDSSAAYPALLLFFLHQSVLYNLHCVGYQASRLLARKRKKATLSDFWSRKTARALYLYRLERPILRHAATEQAPEQQQGFRPFGEKDRCLRLPICGNTKSKGPEKSLNTYKSMCGHVSSHCVRDSLPTTYGEGPLENGTSKIPCPRGCGETFTSY